MSGVGGNGDEFDGVRPGNSDRSGWSSSGGGDSAHGGRQNDGSIDDEDWVGGLEALFEQALVSYYEGSPMFTEAEFQTLRDELEYLGSSHVRLGAMEKLWVIASQERDFDRRVRRELEISEEDLDRIKSRILAAGRERKMYRSNSENSTLPGGNQEGWNTLKPAGIDGDNRSSPRIQSTTNKKSLRDDPSSFRPRSANAFGLSDAEVVESDARIDERVRWLLFGDATEERLKVALLYLPGVVMSFVTATFFTVLFAYLDGEMTITVTNVGRIRLSIVTYVVVTLTFWISNKFTPVFLDYMDLGKPLLIRGPCPNCEARVSCLFTGGARVRDERKCSVCGAMVGFNSRWRKIYLVAPPGARQYSVPD